MTEQERYERFEEKAALALKDQPKPETLRSLLEKALMRSYNISNYGG